MSLVACSSSPHTGPETIGLIYGHAQCSQLPVKFEYVKYRGMLGALKEELLGISDYTPTALATAFGLILMCPSLPHINSE